MKILNKPAKVAQVFSSTEHTPRRPTPAAIESFKATEENLRKIREVRKEYQDIINSW